MELLQYLDMEQGWLNTVEEKLQATENIPESTELVNEALEVHKRSIICRFVKFFKNSLSWVKGCSWG